LSGFKPGSKYFRFSDNTFMKKLFLLAGTILLLNACSQQNIDPSTDSLSKPPKTTCGGADCAEDRT